ncbi:hypothetical protein SNE40_014707 [Patella caerulea]|uniref:Uncharacterized protein n=1 Tax=Patella caerulea TaxID=87958 RepID=A0AAN8JF82_PATCE
MVHDEQGEEEPHGQQRARGVERKVVPEVSSRIKRPLPKGRWCTMVHDEQGEEEPHGQQRARGVERKVVPEVSSRIKRPLPKGPSNSFHHTLQRVLLREQRILAVYGVSLIQQGRQMKQEKHEK